MPEDALQVRTLLALFDKIFDYFPIFYETLRHIKPGLGKHSFQKNATFLRSFAFFIKERGVLCVLLRSL